MNLNGLDYNTDRSRLDLPAYGRIVTEFEALAETKPEGKLKQAMLQRAEEVKIAMFAKYGAGNPYEKKSGEFRKRKRK